MRRNAPLIWLAVVVAAALFLAFRLAGGATVESNILALLPRGERDTAAQSAQDKIASQLSRRVVFLVGDASSARAEAAAHALSDALSRSGLIARLTSNVDADAQRRIADAYIPFRAGLLSPSDRAQLQAGKGQALVSRALAELYSPAGFANAKLIGRDPFLLMPAFLLSLPVPQSKFAVDGDALSTRDGNMTYVLVSADIAGDPFTIKFEESFDALVSGTIAKLQAETPGLAALRTGAVFYAREGAHEAMNETSIIGLASIVGTLALILLVFRGLRPIVLGFLAIGAGIVCAFAGSLLVFERIHVVALLFGVSLIGVSVDYSLQYFCEYFDAEAADPSARLQRVLPGVAIGIATTLIGYCTLLLAPFAGLRQVAAFSLIGLAASVTTVVLWYPLLDAKRAPTGDGRFLKLAGYHWMLWERPSLRSLRRSIFGICAVGALAGLFFLKTDDDVRHLQSLSPDLKRQEAEVERLTGAPAGTQFLLVQGANEQALLETEERASSGLARAEQDGALRGYTSVAQFVPSIARQTSNRGLVQQKLIAPFLPGYLQQTGYQGAIDTHAPHGFLTPADMPKTGVFSLLAALDVSTPGHPMHVVLLNGLANVSDVKARLAGISGVRLLNLTDDWSHLFARYRNYAIALLALSALLMYPLLAWRYGLAGGLKVLAPSLAAVLLAPPLAALAGVSFTFFNAMALVLVLSVGVDYAVFCSETSGARKPVTTLAIALAALSTILAFGMLAFSRVFAVHAFGMTMLIGTTLAYLFAPAVGDQASRAGNAS
jgi:predicted exporter